MVKKIAEQLSELYDLDFWVTTQIKKTLVILPTTHTTDHKAIHDGSWVCLSHKMALPRTHFDNWDKTLTILSNYMGYMDR